MASPRTFKLRVTRKSEAGACGGIAGSVFVFFVTMDLSLILALAVTWIPLAGALWFYFKFVRNKPKYYFDYALNGLFGRRLTVRRRKQTAKRRTKNA